MQPAGVSQLIDREAQDLVDFPHYYFLRLLIKMVSLLLSPYYLTVTVQTKFLRVCWQYKFMILC